MHNSNSLFIPSVRTLYSVEFEFFPSARVAYAMSNVLQLCSKGGNRGDLGGEWRKASMRPTDAVSKKCATLLIYELVWIVDCIVASRMQFDHRGISESASFIVNKKTIFTRH